MKEIFLLLYLFCLTVLLQAQSDYNQTHKISPTFRQNPAGVTRTKQDHFNDSLRNLLTLVKDDSGRFDILGGLAFSNAWSNPDSALLYAQEQLLLAKRIKSVTMEARALWSNGVVLSTMGSYSQALDFFYQDLIIAERLKDKKELFASNLGLCVTYRDQGNYDHSIYYAYRCKNAAENLDSGVKSRALLHIGSIYEKFNYLDSALFFTQSAYQIEKAINRKNKLGAVAYILGNVYAKKGNHSLALQYYRGGIQIAIDLNITKDLMEIYNGMAKTFASIGQIDSSIHYAKQTIYVGKSTRYLAGVIIASSLLTDLYKSQNNNDSTLKYAELTAATQDSLFNLETQNQVRNNSFKERLSEQEAAVEIIQYQNKNKNDCLFFLRCFINCGYYTVH